MSFIEKFFSKNIKLSEHKEATRNKKVEELSLPDYFFYPMSMHIGKPAKPIVSIGDKVKIGTLLGEAEGNISANIHSSVSGEIVYIGEGNSFRGMTDCIVIKNDYKDEHIFFESLPNTLTPEIFSKRLSLAGITGKGGAGFPTHVKYNLEKHKTEYLLINGAECEPFATSDYRCMLEYSDEIVEITRIIINTYSIDKAYIAIEAHMDKAIGAMEESIEKAGIENFKVHKLEPGYPQGHAGLQIQQVLGIEILEGQRSGDVGVLQSNVSTIKAIYDAVVLDKSFHKRIVTVTGPMLNEPKNLMVRIGTQIKYIIDACGGLVDEPLIMINGGPMMGSKFDSVDKPVDKDTTAILFLPKLNVESETDCIRCSKCCDYCPVALQPILISNAFRNGAYHLGEKLNSSSCIRCGSCTYICPSRIDLLSDIDKLNSKLKED